MTETAPEGVPAAEPAAPVPPRAPMRDQRPAPSRPVASNAQPGVDLTTGEAVVDPAVAARDEAVDRMAGFYEENGNADAAERVRARFEEPDATETPGGTTATTR